jgi:hypothetical protein
MGMFSRRAGRATSRFTAQTVKAAGRRVSMLAAAMLGERRHDCGWSRG